MTKPTDGQVALLMGLDPDFFGRKFPQDGVTVSNVSRHGLPQSPLVDNCCFFSGYADRTAWQYARRIIAPAAVLDDAKRILADVKDCPTLEALESLSQ